MNQPPATSHLPHHEFVTAMHDRAITVNFDPKEAARFVSGQLLLPLVMLPVLGSGVALALVGWIWTGLLVIALGIIVPRLIKRSAPHILMLQALEDESVYRRLLNENVMQIVTRQNA